jgi:hypothetical protein
MSADRVTNAPAARVAGISDMLLDGLFTGMIGALIVAVWFLILDSLAGHPLRTPALLGTLLLHGGEAARQVTIAPLEIAVYTAFHFVVFLLVGILLSWLMSLFERFPIMFFVILVVFVCLQFGFFGLNVFLGAQLLGELKAWTVAVGNVLAAAGMALYQWKRHPSVIQGIERLWAPDAEG